MKAIKKLWALVLIFCTAAILGLVGCNGSTDGPGPDPDDGDPTPTTYSVTLTKNFSEEMGTASLSAPASGDKYAKEELVTLTVTVNEGYLVESVTVGSESVELEEGKYSFKVRSDTQVTVSMRAIGYYSVTVGDFDASMGSVSVTPKAGADGTYVEGTQLTLAVSAKYGYKLLSVKVNGSDVTLDESGEYSFTIEKDTAVDVTFGELKKYKMTFYFYETMCSIAYYGVTDDGEEGYLPLAPETETEIYEGETLFSVIPEGGYDIYSVVVNGEEVTLSDQSFTLNVGEELQDGNGKIIVVVSCIFVFTTLDSLAGEYDLAKDAWYSFTLESPAVFEFSASNYVAYAAFFPMTQTDSSDDGSTWTVGDEPVWKFNDDDRSNYAINIFEAGTYMARFSANTGDGAATSKLTVTQLPYLDFEIKDIRANSYVSLDGQYKLYLGSHYLAIKDKDGHALDATVTRTTDDKGAHTHVAFGGKTYLLGTKMPTFHSDDPDGSGEEYVATPVDGLIVSLFIKTGDTVTEEIDFRPDPLPKDITIAEELAGTYTGTTYDADEKDIPVEGDLVVRGNTIKWGEKEITLLRSLAVCSDLNEVPENLSVGYCKEEVFFLFAIFSDNVYRIGISGGSYPNQVTFSPKEDQGGVTIEERFFGTWTCKIETAPLYGYTLVITANNIVVTDANGRNVQTTLGTHTYRNTVYTSFTVNGATYFLYNIMRGSLIVCPTEGTITNITFVAA